MRVSRPIPLCSHGARAQTGPSDAFYKRGAKVRVLTAMIAMAKHETRLSSLGPELLLLSDGLFFFQIASCLLLLYI